jgi:dTDP-4-amino-4,6-dideoxygalactose transaminase
MAKRVGIMRSHGIDRTIFNRYTDKKASWYYEVVAPGYKDNMPDVLAAIGRVQLRRAYDLLNMRRAIAQRYNEAFKNNKCLSVPYSNYPNYGEVLKNGAWHLYPLLLNLNALKIDRAAFITRLQEKGVGVSVHFIPLHIMPYYSKHYNLKPEDCPNALETYKREISLPIWPGQTPGQVSQVINAVLETAEENAR